MNMKKQILISLILLSSVLTAKSQWTYPNGIADYQGAVNVNGNITSKRLFAITNYVENTQFGTNPGLTISLGATGQFNNDNSLVFATSQGIMLGGISGRYDNYGAGTIAGGHLSFYTLRSAGAVPLEALKLTNTGNAEFYGSVSLPGIYNFEQVKLGQYGNGACGLEFINHNGASTSYGVRFLSNCDNDQFGNRGIFGLQIQTANPSDTYQGLSYTTRLAIGINGNIGIGTNTPAYTLDVIGTIRAREIIVNTDGSDFVFDSNYKLPPLGEVESFVRQNKHLPNIPSAAEMQTNGVKMGELQNNLLQKVEELTLYTIEQEKKIQEQEKKISDQEKKNVELEQKIEELKELINQKLN
jgi:hypothetical protein